jgi:putative MATE family efflux protein
MNDLTVGRPWTLLRRFALPLLLSTALQQLYYIADSVILGQYTGSAGLAAIGAAYPITLFFLAVATGSAMGISVVASQLYGAKRMDALKTSIYTALISMGGLGFILTALGVGLASPLLRWLNATGEVYTGGRAYLAIYSAGLIPMLIYNASNAVFTGLGDSRRPLLFLLFSSVLNVLLDLLAVAVLGWGIIGAAWATTFSQLAAAALAVVVLLRRTREIETEERTKAFDRTLFGSMCRIAVPSIFQQACVALAHTIVQSLVNTYSVSVVAGYEAASKIHNFAYMSFNTMGTALSSFAAQNYGAGRGDRVKEGFRTGTLMCFCLTVVVVLIFQLLPRQLMGLFVDPGQEAEVVETGIKYMRIISPDYLIICFIITFGGLFRGVGKIMDFFLVTVWDFTVRVVMCFVLTKALDSYTGLFWAWYFGSVADVIPCFIIYKRMDFSKGERLKA